MSVAVSSAWNVLLQIVIWFITLFRFDLCLNRFLVMPSMTLPCKVVLLYPALFFFVTLISSRCYVMLYVMLLLYYILYYIIHLFFLMSFSPSSSM